MTAKLSIGIVGSGIIGRLIAWDLAMRGCKVDIFEQSDATDETSSSFAAAGMLAPFSELEHAPPQVAAWGLQSINLWRGIATKLGAEQSLTTRGTIIAAHPADECEMRRLRDLWHRVCVEACYEVVSAHQMHLLESDLKENFTSAYFIGGEGHIHVPHMMRSIERALADMGHPIRFGSVVNDIKSRSIVIADQERQFDWVIDCRGFDAQRDIPVLRGVRGEIFLVHAQAVNISRPVRIMHPRYPLYIVPRGDGHYVVGATIIENESREPPTVRSTLELMSALYAVHSAFGEARILDARAQVRPAFVDNIPRINFHGRLLRVNGLYRHGFLLGPLIADRVGKFLVEQIEPSDLASIWQNKSAG